MATSKIIDAFVAYQFIKLLSTPWKDTDAYKLGIIDEKGKVLKKSRKLKTSKEKAAYTMIHRLVWNVKRLLDKLPAGQTRIGSFTTALWMLREQSEIGYGADFTLSYESFKKYLQEEYNISSEDLIMESNNSILKSGTYELKYDVDGPGSGSRKKDIIVVANDLEAEEVFAGNPMFMVTNKRTGEEIFVSNDDIKYLGESISGLDAPDYIKNPATRDVLKSYKHILTRDYCAGEVRFMGNEEYIYVWDSSKFTHRALNDRIGKGESTNPKYFGMGTINNQGQIVEIDYISHKPYSGMDNTEAIDLFKKTVNKVSPYLVSPNLL